jgi:hypothetical protein
MSQMYLYKNKRGKNKQENKKQKQKTKNKQTNKQTNKQNHVFIKRYLMVSLFANT